MLDLSFVMAPLGITWMGHLYRVDGFAGLPILRSFWLLLIGFYWLAYIGVVSNYVRGYFAERRDVQPAPPGRKPALAYMKWLSIICGVIACIFALLIYLMSMRRIIHGAGGLWASELLLLVLFFQNISTYTRNRFWDASLV